MTSQDPDCGEGATVQNAKLVMALLAVSTFGLQRSETYDDTHVGTITLSTLGTVSCIL